MVIGEKLNSSVPAAQAAFAAHDAAAVLEMAKKQVEYGAQYLDVNTAMMPNEAEDLLWVCGIITDNTDANLVVDTPSAAVAKEVYDKLSPEAASRSILNSITPEPERFSGMLEILKEHEGMGVVALPVGGGAMPKTADERVAASSALLAELEGAGIAQGRIYLDLLVEAVGADFNAGAECLKACLALRSAFPSVHLLAGLSNVSFGLPNRSALNSAFLACLMTSGADTFILNPLQKETMLAYHASELLLGRDEYCMQYISFCRFLQDQ